MSAAPGARRPNPGIIALMPVVPSARPGAPFAALVLTFALTVIVAGFVISAGRTRDTARFDRLVDDTALRIQTRLDTYIELLRAASALFASSTDVEGREFRAFMTHLRVGDRYPGVQGIGFSRRLRADQRARFEAAQQARDPGFHVWPESTRDEYHAIVYLEPPDRRNQAAIGYDMFTEPTRHAAMARARDTGEPAASGKVTLVQEIDDAKQPGFLIYVPVYRPGSRAASATGRREALAGFVYAAFRATDLLRGTVPGQATAAVTFRIYDGAAEDPAALLHASADADAAQARFAATRTIAVAGRPWTIAFHSRRAFDERPPWRAAALTFGVGTLLAVLLFIALRTQHESLAAARQHAAELGRSEEALRAREADLRDLIAREREARERAEAADHGKDEFLATLSHELRTPLNAIMGWASMLRAGKMRAERHDEALDVIARNARALTRLVEDLLDMSRVITGKMRLELTPVPLAPILRDTVDTVRPSAEARGVTLATRIDEGVGTVLGDPARLQQILWNVLSNAIKFTDAGGTVTVSAHASEGQVHVAIHDTGIGIAPGFLPHVFDRFRQADSSTTRSHGGVGLGLSIVRHLVELHGGRIEATSPGPRQGATFTVHLTAAPLARRASPGVQ